eukprot:CAMPEP_0113662772 /NCGR_PEP_ID=MMETSP0038_2-20120614/765_1 /TAXON_ID=2898 /ORGANISM="Cryptomonas paramecium" /LENGTH=69 /DNA_ID=CAMNT_0000577711 /DNA_START=58 /DNA_END=267 /DNA_ORIENTATION=- /assembly_acc=CAM_ASM_000170
MIGNFLNASVEAQAYRAQRLQILYSDDQSSSVDPITAALLAHGDGKSSHKVKKPEVTAENFFSPTTKWY